MARFIPVDDAADPRIAEFTRLRSTDPRDGLIAEGALVIRHLLASPYPVRSLLVTDRGVRALAGDLDGLDAPAYIVPQDLMARICGFEFHRGALAAAERIALPDVPAAVAAARLVLAVEGVNDHENLGALFRNAAAFGAGAVVLDPTAADPLYRRCLRVSMGHALRVPFARAQAWPDAITTLQHLGYEVLGLTPAADAIPIQAVGPAPRRALLVGAEGPGLSAAAQAAVDRRVRIDLAPGVDSLNVATAAAIALHRLAPPSQG